MAPVGIFEFSLPAGRSAASAEQESASLLQVLQDRALTSSKEFRERFGMSFAKFNQ